MKKGFFNLNPISIPARQSNIPGCGACGLYKHCKTPKKEITGNGKLGIFILGEIVSAAEDKGEENSKLLRTVLKKNGIDLEEDCWKMNAVSCRSLSNEGNATDTQIGYCYPRVLKELKEKKPHIIILLGTTAVQSFFTNRWHGRLEGITKWRGWTVPDRNFNAWVCPTYHPSYVADRMNNEPVLYRIFQDDIKRAIDCLHLALPRYEDERKNIKILDTPRIIQEKLNTILTIKPKYIAFDYETTGLKPHAKGQKISSCSITYNGNDAVSWMWDDIDHIGISLFKQILTNPDIGKIASNMKFEDNWTFEKLNIKIQGWAWDTMLAGHVMDNRSGITSIKFLAYVLLGVLPWNEKIEPFLKSNGSGNGLNRIDELDTYEQLIYNGLDSIYEYQVAMIQMGMTK